MVDVESNHYQKIKAVFFLNETFTWPSFESVYEAFSADPACETQLVYVPFEHVGSDKDRDWFDDYAAKGLPVIRCQDYDLAVESPDFVFFVKPFDSIPKQFYIDNVDRIVRRSIYIPYGVKWVDYENVPLLIRYHFQLPLQKMAWKIFNAPNDVRENYVRYGQLNPEKVELVGHPRFDGIGKLAKMKDNIPVSWKKKIGSKKIFMWNSHFSSRLKNNPESDWSTFESLGKKILSRFMLDKDIVLLWRPHPFFFNSLLACEIMTKIEIEELQSTIDRSENIILDTLDDYRYAFSIADALISDASGLLSEFIEAEKPILFTYKEGNDSIVNKKQLPAYYKASTWEDIEKFIVMVIEGKDPKKHERLEMMKYFGIDPSRNVGKVVKEICIADMIKEESAYGTLHA
jgi:hypothetical protein